MKPRFYESDETMSIDFLTFLNKPNMLTIASGFNANQSYKKDRASELGYDLPFICYRACLRLDGVATTSNFRFLS